MIYIPVSGMCRTALFARRTIPENPTNRTGSQLTITHGPSSFSRKKICGRKESFLLFSRYSLSVPLGIHVQAHGRPVYRWTESFENDFPLFSDSSRRRSDPGKNVGRSIPPTDYRVGKTKRKSVRWTRVLLLLREITASAV